MEIKKRKPNRLKNYDYSQNGAYFITICTHNKICLLSSIVGGGVLDAPKIQLTKTGVVVRKFIISIDKIYDYISVDKYVIMPNHVHFILNVHNSKNGMPRTSSPTNAAIPSMISTFKRFVNKECEMSIFQRSYHDHIIRNEAEYKKVWEYIDTNPSKWQDDCYYSK